MRFPATEQLIDCTALNGPAPWDQAVAEVVTEAATALRRHGFVVFRIGALRWDEDRSRDVAHQLTAALRTRLVRDGAPGEMYLEADAAQPTPVPDARQVRTLLPHHDGQHSSYLTPSLLDDPEWDPTLRTFSDTGYTTTHPHKLYQGIFIAHPGEGLSVTTYYDWLRILDDVKELRGDTGDLSTPRWLARNIRDSFAATRRNGSAYPTVAGFLGLTEEALLATPLLHCERPLAEAVKERFPLLRSLSTRCPCGECQGEVRRVFCHVTTLGAGLNWREFRERYEILAPSERFDLLLGDNLTMHHGGLAGGPGRVIEPLCLVLDEPRGPAYESWLHGMWRRPTGDATAAAGSARVAEVAR
ncbi:hypothetical protein DR950_39410 [Kitasatospora xanthocidica]|uniref:TauD/TfdA-like domain-containing protein n=1 Tax=Kitasatospora xanthocidica TaxID=83382 RepID=A0A372ZHX6_9ACTN|nr:hypothetical protein [Kitasatospora xanthocidica]RGD55443.1 hypothetical protein DR950_39410 [Kitasatospora xanthocidica]